MKLNNAKVIDTALSLMESERAEAFIDEFHHGLFEAVEKTKGYTIAFVESAVELTPEERKQLEKELTVILRHGIEIRYSVQPELLGGFRITVGDWKLDASIANELRKLVLDLRKGG